MYVVLTTLYPDNPGIHDWLGIGDALRGRDGVTAIALVGAVVAVWVFAQLRPARGRRVRGRDRRERRGRPGRRRARRRGRAGRSPGRGGRRRPVGAASTAAFASGGGASPRRRSPALALGARRRSRRDGDLADRRRGDARPGTSRRPSRSSARSAGSGRSSRSGRSGRIARGRSTARAAAGSTGSTSGSSSSSSISILGIRMFRLAEPYQMHFDEVYHARTATEFLQDWRYGMTHDIYEWTHPHLAKYAMAGGLVAWGDNQVTATSEPGRARRRRRDRAATRRPGPGRRHRRRPGGRRHRLGGPLVRPVDPEADRDDPARPALGRSRWTTTGSGWSSATDDGSIWTIDATALDTVSGVGQRRAPAAGVARQGRPRGPPRSSRRPAARCWSRRATTG